MKLTMNEVACTFFALNQDKEGKTRRFQFTELAKVSEIAKKLEVCVKDGKVANKDHELDFSTDEKAFIKEKTEELDWSLGDASTILTLTKKLNA